MTQICVYILILLKPVDSEILDCPKNEKQSQQLFLTALWTATSPRKAFQHDQGKVAAAKKTSKMSFIWTFDKPS